MIRIANIATDTIFPWNVTTPIALRHFSSINLDSKL